MVHVLLINPNTNAVTTGRMVDIAREATGARLEISGRTATQGVPLITNERELAAACLAVPALVSDLPVDCAGIVLSAFGDPGLADLRRQISIPIVGIGEAGIRAAARHRRRFAVATTTLGLRHRIEATIAALGLSACYVGMEVTDGDPAELTADPKRLEAALGLAVSRAIDVRAAQAVVIGGGPLAVAARELTRHFTVPIIEPIPEAVRWLERAMRHRGGNKCPNR